MTSIVRNVVLAVSLLGSAALISAPVLAAPHKSGNSWNKSAKHDSYRQDNRSYGYNRAPGYAYAPHRYGYGSGYGYGSRYGYGRGYDGAPGLSINIR